MLANARSDAHSLSWPDKWRKLGQSRSCTRHSFCRAFRDRLGKTATYPFETYELALTQDERGERESAHPKYIFLKAKAINDSLIEICNLARRSLIQNDRHNHLAQYRQRQPPFFDHSVDIRLYCLLNKTAISLMDSPPA